MAEKKYKVLERDVAAETIQQWQNMVDTLAAVFSAPAALIMRVHEKEIEVFVSSQTSGNPYKTGAKEVLKGTLYCEKVMNEDRLLYIDDARRYDEWKTSPDIPLNMTSYLGIPIHWPSGETFGTLCILASNPVRFSNDPKLFQELLGSFEKVIEEQLKLLFEIEKRRRAEKTIEKKNATLEQRVRERTRDLEQNENRYRKMCQQLHESEARFRAIFNQISDGILAADPVSGKIILANQGTSQITGCEADDLIGRHISDIHPKEDFPYILKQYERQAKGEIQLAGDIPVLRKDGTTVYCDINSQPVKIGDKRLLLGIFRDISDRRKAQEKESRLKEQLLQSQKLEAIGTLAGGVAHDFNNMLTVIQGNIQYLAMKTDKDSSALKFINNIRTAAERASDLTRQLILYSRRESMNYTLFNPNQTIEELLKMLKRLIGENITIKTGFDSGLTELCADQGNFEQIIMNMAVNARDAMPEGGTLTISTTHLAEVPQTELPPPATQPAAVPHARITVADTGCGMDDETRRHIFDPFYTTKKRGQGTGLGLSVVHGIVKEHKGWIRVHSRPNAGTTFDIFFPLNLEKHKAGQDKEISDKIIKSKANGRILLVEDDRLVREITQLILTDAGYSVTAAENAEQASELFSEQNMAFDLVFSDAILPGKNGIDLIEELQNKKPELKALLGSGYSGDRTQHDSIKERNIPFTRKPYKMKNLLETVRQVLSE